MSYSLRCGQGAVDTYDGNRIDRVLRDVVVGSYEADAAKGTLSVTAPLARALIGKTVGDSVEVVAPGGAKFYEIVEVTFK